MERGDRLEEHERACPGDGIDAVAFARSERRVGHGTRAADALEQPDVLDADGGRVVDDLGRGVAGDHDDHAVHTVGNVLQPRVARRPSTNVSVGWMGIG